LSALYLAAFYIIEPPYVIATLNGAFMGVTAAVVICYWQLLINAFRYAPFNRVAQLGLGISLLWIAVIAGRLQSIYWRVIKPDLAASASPIMNNVFTGYIIFLGIVAGVLHVTGASMNVNGKFLRGRTTLAVCVTVGLLVGLVTSVLQLPGS
jgi:hypothetical protein